MPAASVKIHVTVLLPLLNFKDCLVELTSTLASAISVAPLTLYLMLVIPQLSLPENVNSMVVSQAVFRAFAIGVIEEQTGLVLSSTLIEVVQVPTLLWLSVTVQYTVEEPTGKVDLKFAPVKSVFDPPSVNAYSTLLTVQFSVIVGFTTLTSYEQAVASVGANDIASAEQIGVTLSFTVNFCGHSIAEALVNWNFQVAT